MSSGISYGYWNKDVNEIKLSAGKYYLSKTEKSILNISKVRVENHCNLCDNTLKSGSYCLGRNYNKICLSCIPQFLENFSKSMEDYSLQAKQILDSLKLNEEKYRKHNLLMALK